MCALGHNAKYIHVGYHLNKTFKIPIYTKKEHISDSVSPEQVMLTLKVRVHVYTKEVVWHSSLERRSGAKLST